MTPYVALDCGTNKNKPTLQWHPTTCIASSNFIANTYARDGIVRVFSLFTTGKPRRTFRKHEQNVSDVLHIFGDVVVSVDEEGQLYSWDVSTGATLTELRVKDEALLSAKQIDSNTLILGACPTTTWLKRKEITGTKSELNAMAKRHKLELVGEKERSKALLKAVRKDHGVVLDEEKRKRGILEAKLKDEQKRSRRVTDTLNAVATELEIVRNGRGGNEVSVAKMKAA